MKTLIVVFGLLAWIGSCNDETDMTSENLQETDAAWVNQLAADGCSWHFAVASGDSTIFLAPEDGSLLTIEKAVGKIEDAYSSTDVHLKYSFTGKKKQVECGWGAKPSFDEIKVHAIFKK